MRATALPAYAQITAYLVFPRYRSLSPALAAMRGETTHTFVLTHGSKSI